MECEAVLLAMLQTPVNTRFHYFTDCLSPMPVHIDKWFFAVQNLNTSKRIFDKFC